MRALSCCCLTYGRPEMLEEAIESFLVQDYPGPRELVVLNDQPDMVYTPRNYPGVQVFNNPSRFRSLGDKWNAAVRLCRHPVIVSWHDDDICFPWMLSAVERGLADADHYQFRGTWLQNDGAVSWLNAVMTGVIVITRTAFDVVGGYPNADRGVDKMMLEKLKGANLHGKIEQFDHKSAFYLYRRGSRSISGYSKTNAWKELEIPVGMTTEQHVLNPKWRENYPEWVKRKAMVMMVKAA